MRLSRDGVAWTTAWAGLSSGATLELESYDLGQAVARYVLIVGHGTNRGTRNGFTETEIWGR